MAAIVPIRTLTDPALLIVAPSLALRAEATDYARTELAALIRDAVGDPTDCVRTLWTTIRAWYAGSRTINPLIPESCALRRWCLAASQVCIAARAHWRCHRAEGLG